MTAANIRLGQGTAPAPSAGEGILYFDSGDQQLYVIDAAGATVGPITGGGGGGGVTAANAIWVQTAANGGNDGTGTRGDSSKPFVTIAAALAVAQNDDVVYVGTGFFTGPADVSAINPTLDSIYIIGSGRESTWIADSGGGVTFDLSGTQWVKFSIASCTISAGQYTIIANGAAYPAGAYLPSGGFPSIPWGSGLFLTDVLLEGAISGGAGGTLLYNVGLGVFDRVTDSTALTGELSVTLVGIFAAVNSSFQNVSVTRDFDDPNQPSPGVCTLQRCGLNQTTTIKKQAHVELDDCKLSSLVGDGLNVSGGGVAPLLSCARSVGTSIDLSSAGAEIPDTAANVVLVFVDSAFAQASFAVAAPAANRQTVRLTGCAFPAGAPSLSCGDGVDGDARGSSFVDYSTSIATIGTGAVAISSFPVAAVPTVLPVTVIPYPFTLMSLPYVFVPSGDTLAEAPLAVASKTLTDAGVAATAAVGGTIGGIVLMF